MSRSLPSSLDAALRAVMWGIIVGAFAIAGASKVISLKPTSDVIGAVLPWAGMNRGQLTALAALVLGSEVFVVVAIVVGVRSRWLICWTIAMLVVFTLVLAYLLTLPAPPSCGCMAILRAQSNAVSDAVIGIVRNIALMGVLAFLYQGTAGPTHAHGPVGANSSAARAFTLVELLAGLAVIGALIAILLPSLRSARLAAKDTGLLAKLPNYTAGVVAYCGDHRDVLPYAQSPRRPDLPAVIGEVTLEHAYFLSVGWFWPNMLTPGYLAVSPREFWFENDPRGTQAAASNRVNGYPEDFIRSSVRMTYTTSAAPAYWRDDVANDLQELVPQQSSTVLYPSLKGLLLDLRAGIYRKSASGVVDQYEFPFLLTGYVDGSGGKLPFEQSMNDGCVSRPYGAQQSPVQTTRDGLWGRDRK